MCYTYLVDVDIQHLQTSNILTNRGFSFRTQDHADQIHSNNFLDSQVFSMVSKSRWFTRGWTLQELLAPSQVIFFSADWTVLGDRNRMSNWIADITRIHIGALNDRSTIQHYSIAQRMSWAATRETTRSEDTAYCLLGIFNIHMPMLYGEGQETFQRLQQEIIRISDDHSIFSWNLQAGVRELCTGALAASPKAFLSCGSVVRYDDIWRFPFSITNLGISIEFPLIKSWYEGIFLVELNCARELRGCEDPLDVLPGRRTACRRVKIWIFLRHVQHNIYQRVHLPVSTVLLQPSYTVIVQQAKTALFIEIQKSHHSRSLTLPEPLIPTVRKPIHDSMFSSGVITTFGWGTKNRFNRYEQAFDLGNFCSQVLKARSPMGISHQLVSNQNFTSIFSVAWDISIKPRHWIHSTFADADRRFWKGIVGVDKWMCLFDGIRTPVNELGHLIDNLSHLHSQLRQDFSEDFQQANRSLHTPMIIVSHQELQNLRGQRELLVDIIFRERPERVME